MENKMGSPKTVLTSRNIAIAKEVLQGETLRSVAQRHTLTRERVRMIAIRVCYITNSKLFNQIEWALSVERLDWLRARKNHFLSAMNIAAPSES